METKPTSRPGEIIRRPVKLLFAFLFLISLHSHSQSCSAEFWYSGTSSNTYAFQLKSAVDTVHYSFLWNFGDGTSSTLKYPQHQYGAPGVYGVCLTIAKDDNSCTKTWCDSISVKPPVTCWASFTFIHDSSNPKIIYLSNHSTGNNLKYLWNFGDGQTSTSGSPGSHTYLTDAAHIISLRITDTVSNCASDFYDTVFSSVCAPSFTAYRLHSYSYQLTAPVNPNAYYFWDFGDGTSATTAVNYVEHQFPDNQTYNVCLRMTLKDSSCSKLYCNGVDVNVENCHAAFSITPDSSTSDSSDFIIYDLSTGANLSYLWDFGDGTTSTLKNPTHDYTGDGPYLIFLTVSNDSCKSVYHDTIDFKDPLHPHLPGKWHVKVVNKNTTDIRNNSADRNNLQNYPNPFSGVTTINYSIYTSSTVELSIYNLLGNKLEIIEAATKAPGNYSLEWQSKNLPEGIYLLQLKTDQQIITRKALISK